MSEYGEPLEWKRDAELETTETYRLCRCGQSKIKPFCDSSHTPKGFQGDESADPANARRRFQGKR